MRKYIHILLFIIVLLVPNISSAEVMKVLVAKEINDQNIIIVTEKGYRLLLQKWSLKFSPLLFEGKVFMADVTPFFVNMFIEGKGELKWSIEKHLGTVNLGEKPKQKKSSYNIYTGVGSGHWIETVSSGGKFITLEDGSLWEIASSDTVFTSIWLPISNIIVIENVGQYPYILINTDDGEKVNAKYYNGQ